MKETEALHLQIAAGEISKLWVVEQRIRGTVSFDQDVDAHLVAAVSIMTTICAATDVSEQASARLARMLPAVIEHIEDEDLRKRAFNLNYDLGVALGILTEDDRDEVLAGFEGFYRTAVHVLNMGEGDK